MTIFDISMKSFEDIYDLKFLPEIHIVARLDGRGFSSLTNSMKAIKPFDDNFQEIMSYVTSRIIKDSGFNIIYGYHQSDEISLLFKKNIYSFDRRVNKYVSILASLASSIFTCMSGKVVSFDCRLSYLPTDKSVVDYFQWRQQDSSRNCINSYCYWKLREKHPKKYVVNFLRKKSASDMQEILFQEGVNYNDIVPWQKRGTGYYIATLRQNMILS